MPWLLSQPPDRLQIPWLQSAKRGRADNCMKLNSTQGCEIKRQEKVRHLEVKKKKKTKKKTKPETTYRKKSSYKINPNFCLGKYWFARLQACTLRPLKSKLFSKRWLSEAEEEVLQERFLRIISTAGTQLSVARDLQKFPNSLGATRCSAPSTRHNYLFVYIRTPNPRNLFLQIVDFLFTNRAANSFPQFWYSMLV